MTFNWQQATEAAASYLLNLGHKQIAFISTMKLDDENWRYLGYRAALASHGLPLDDSLLVFAPSPDEFQSGQIGVERLLARSAKATAILAFNDMVATGAMSTLIDAGFRVPTDISIMGHDDIALASIIRPSLSTVRVPKKEQGRLLSWILARILLGEEIQRVWLLEGGLVIRQTTQRPILKEPASRRD